MLAVVCTLIREARCSLMISYSLFKYMVLYGFIESVVSCVAFFVARTDLFIPQVTFPVVRVYYSSVLFPAFFTLQLMWLTNSHGTVLIYLSTLGTCSGA